MQKFFLIKKIRRNLLFCLFFSDFLLIKQLKKNFICIQSVSLSFIFELIYSLKLFCRLIFFSKKVCKRFSFLYPDVFYIDLLRKICFKYSFFSKFFFNTIINRFDFIKTSLSMHFLPIFKFFDVNFQNFLKQQNMLLILGIGFLSIKRFPGKIYFLRNSFDDIKKIIFLGTFLVKNLNVKFRLKNKKIKKISL